jgi:hypothetical protein
MPLFTYLDRRYAVTVVLTFEQIESLPDSRRRHQRSQMPSGGRAPVGPTIATRPPGPPRVAAPLHN